MKQTDTLHKLPISVSYWKSAIDEFKNIRSLMVSALLCAVAIIMERFQIPIIPGVLEVAFSFIAISLCSFLTGPILAIPCGIIVDIVGALINGYSFFFGYTLSAIMGAVIYALFLYRANLSFGRIALSKLTVNLLVNVILGSVWRVAMSGGPYGYYVAISGIKNLLLLPLEVFMQAMLPSLKRMNFCNKSQNIKVSRTKIIIFTLLLVVGTALLIIYSINKSEINAKINSLFRTLPLAAPGGLLGATQKSYPCSFASSLYGSILGAIQYLH